MHSRPSEPPGIFRQVPVSFWPLNSTEHSAPSARPRHASIAAGGGCGRSWSGAGGASAAALASALERNAANATTEAVPRRMEFRVLMMISPFQVAYDHREPSTQPFEMRFRPKHAATVADAVGGRLRNMS